MAIKRRVFISSPRDPRLDRRDHLELGAVEMDDQRNVRPVAVHGVELWSEVMEMDDIGLAGAGIAQGSDPCGREMVGELRRDCREHDIRHSGPIFIRGVHRW